MSLHPDDAAAYILFLEDQVEQARSVMTGLLHACDSDIDNSAYIKAREWLWK
jgi:hypothetical protein